MGGKRAAAFKGDVPFKKTKTGIAIDIRVKPRSSSRGIERVEGGSLVVRLTAPPAEGEANAQLVEVLSEALGVRKGAIRIARGRASRNKLVEVEGLEGAAVK